MARRVFFRLGVFLGSALVSAGCAARTVVPPAPVDLSPARAALENARLLSGAEANDCFVKAEGHLNEAESLAGTGEPEKTRQAEWLARLSLVESHCATTIAKIAEAQRVAVPPTPTVRPKEVGVDLRAKLNLAEGEQRKLEERVAVLERTLEITETEVVRAKAKLKGIETKAEASSAIAEARILLRRLQADKGRTLTLNLAQDRLDAAVEKLQGGEYSRAALYVLQVQEMLEQVRRGSSVDSEQKPSKKQYVVQAAIANLRNEPSTDARVLSKVPKGTTLKALAARSGWVQVDHNGQTGWILESLLE